MSFIICLTAIRKQWSWMSQEGRNQRGRDSYYSNPPTICSQHLALETLRCATAIYDDETLPAGLSDPPQTENIFLACWHTGEGEQQLASELPQEGTWVFYTKSARTLISGRATVVPVSEQRRKRRRAEFQIVRDAMTTIFWYTQGLPFLFFLLRRSGYVPLGRLVRCYWCTWLNATCPEMTLCSRQYARIQSLLPLLWSSPRFFG